MVVKAVVFLWGGASGVRALPRGGFCQRLIVDPGAVAFGEFDELVALAAAERLRVAGRRLDAAVFPIGDGRRRDADQLRRELLRVARTRGRSVRLDIVFDGLGFRLCLFAQIFSREFRGDLAENRADFLLGAQIVGVIGGESLGGEGK